MVRKVLVLGMALAALSMVVAMSGCAGASSQVDAPKSSVSSTH